MSSTAYSSIKGLFNLSAQASKRLAWMDYAKGIAITMVVLRHISIGIQRAGLAVDPFTFEVIDNVGLTFRMPLFFLLSGIFFRMSIEKRSQLGYITHKSKTILYPYLIWSFIVTSLQIVLSSHINTAADWHSYLDIFINPWGHWWFLVALFNVSVFYLALHSLSGGRHILLLLAGLVFYYVSPYTEGISILYHVLRLFVFFALGDLLSKAVLNKANSIYLSSSRLLLLFVAFAIVGEYLLFQPEWRNNLTMLLVFALAGSCCTIWASYQLAAKQNRVLSVLRTVGQHSLYVYLLHAPIGAAMRILFTSGLGITEFWILMPVNTIASIYLSIVLYRLSMKTGLWFLFSPEGKAKPTPLKTVNS